MHFLTLNETRLRKEKQNAIGNKLNSQGKVVKQ